MIKSKISYETATKKTQTTLFNFPKVDKTLKNDYDRVLWLFRNYPTTVQSDTYLIKYYRHYFTDPEKKLHILKNLSEHIRNKLGFVRNERAAMVAVQFEHSYIIPKEKE